jgi:gliding motility-associated-like protein
MNKIKFYILCLSAIVTLRTVFSQVPNCLNLGFELGNFTNWVGYTWNYSTEHPELTTPPVEGIVYRRQTIITDNNAYDSLTGNELKLIPPGYQYSCRLGDVIVNREVDPLYSRCWQQSLRYTMTIDSSNAMLILKFAVVLQYIDNHLTIEEPRFRFTLYDENGDTIPDCANYDVYATNQDVKGFNFIPSDSPGEGVMWRDWTTVGVDLSNYMGQTIIVEFMTADCTQTWHFGYGYFVASCQPLNITISYCEKDSTALLIAPEGFENYSWTNNSGTVIDTFQILEVTDPIEGAIYSCSMISATDCEVSLNTAIAKYTPRAAFGSYMIDCNSNKVQLTNSSTTNNGYLFYLWDFGDGFTSYEPNPLYTFITSGRHQVSLSIVNPPSSCTDVLTKEVESFSPPLVGIDGYSTYCPGESTFLKAYGAYYYTWNTGSYADSIEVSAPGGEYSLIGRSTTGCSDTNYITVSEEPEWEFLAEGDTVLCIGDTSLLIASGAFEYLWNTGDTTNSISVSTPGNYSIIGKNRRGCEKSELLNVMLSRPPRVDFTVSDYTLDSRNNELTCSLPAQINVQYLWNMDDGSTEIGSFIHHAYTISNYKLFYDIVLEATDKFGCKNSSSKIINVIPFIPNVFSPNGDGINDVFMPGLELQIYDRYGLVLYKGIDGWDGRYNGSPVDPDTYFYSISYADYDQVEHSKKGYLTLVR